LTFVGHSPFAKPAIYQRWEEIDANAVLGIPYDMGTRHRAGARTGPDTDAMSAAK